MHAALHALQPEANAASAPLPQALPRDRRWVGSALIAALAVAATAAALAAAWPLFGDRSAPGERPAALPTVEVAQSSIAPRMVDVAPVAPPAVATPKEPAPTEPAPTEPAPAEPAPAEPARLAIQVASSVDASDASGASGASDAGEAIAAPNDDEAQAVARAVAALEQAMRAGDLDAGKAHLDELAAMLPARSLTLLRMQAWHAHQSGDAVQAIALYGEVVQRVPGDRNAAINLAVLEAGQGDIEGASQRLRALRTSAGESAELAAAMALVGAQPR